MEACGYGYSIYLTGSRCGCVKGYKCWDCNKLTCAPPSLLPLIDRTCVYVSHTLWVCTNTVKSASASHTAHCHAPVKKVLHLHTQTHAQRHTLIQIETAPGPRLRPPGERELSFSSCLGGNLPSDMNSELPGRRP